MLYRWKAGAPHRAEAFAHRTGEHGASTRVSWQRVTVGAPYRRLVSPARDSDGREAASEISAQKVAQLVHAVAGELEV